MTPFRSWFLQANQWHIETETDAAAPCGLAQHKVSSRMTAVHPGGDTCVVCSAHAEKTAPREDDPEYQRLLAQVRNERDCKDLLQKCADRNDVQGVQVKMALTSGAVQIEWLDKYDKLTKLEEQKVVIKRREYHADYQPYPEAATDGSWWARGLIEQLPHFEKDEHRKALSNWFADALTAGRHFGKAEARVDYEKGTRITFNHSVKTDDAAQLASSTLVTAFARMTESMRSLGFEAERVSENFRSWASAMNQLAGQRWAWTNAWRAARKRPKFISEKSTNKKLPTTPTEVAAYLCLAHREESPDPLAYKRDLIEKARHGGVKSAQMIFDQVLAESKGAPRAVVIPHLQHVFSQVIGPFTEPHDRRLQANWQIGFEWMVGRFAQTHDFEAPKRTVDIYQHIRVYTPTFNPARADDIVERMTGVARAPEHEPSVVIELTPDVRRVNPVHDAHDQGVDDGTQWAQAPADALYRDYYKPDAWPEGSAEREAYNLAFANASIQ